MLGPPPTPWQIARAEQDIIDSRRREAWEAEQRRKMACRWCGTRGGEFCSDRCRKRWRAQEGWLTDDRSNMPWPLWLKPGAP